MTGIMAALALSEQIEIWHIYLWAFISGMVWMIVRPAYKVIITEVVPAEEVRPAVALNSITETTALVLINIGGSALIGWLGLPVAFILNSVSYLVALYCLWKLKSLGQIAGSLPGRISTRRLFTDLRDGLVYLMGNKGLLYPLLFTLTIVTIASPTTSLLAAIVHKQGGSIVLLGLLGGAASLGAFSGAIFAGLRGEGNPMRTYSVFGLIGASAMTVFAFHPIDVAGGIALFVLGFLAFAQAVWNTSRVPRLAGAGYQARIQSVSSMAFTLGTPLGALWGGIAIDRFGQPALVVGGGILAVISIIVLITFRED
jgi:predicted MFS family arabinose efflux permease